MGKNDTMRMAVELFNIFDFRIFSKTQIIKRKLVITESDIDHIKMFNCLRICWRNNNGGENHEAYQFTKKPKIDLSLPNSG